LEIQPEYAEAHYNLALALWQSGEKQAAIKHWQEALRIRPDNVAVCNDLGKAFVNTGKVPEAIKYYQQALKIQPDYAEAGNNLAWLLATLSPAEGGDPVRAVALAQRACETAENCAAPYLDTLAAAYAAAGRFAEAVATAQTAMDLAASAGQRQLAAEIKTRLKLYRSGRPYHQPRVPLRSQSTDTAHPGNP